MRLNSTPILCCGTFLLLAISAQAQQCGYNQRNFLPDGEGGELGRSVSGAGDVDNDGFDDIVVGAPYEADDNGAYSGSARIFSGQDGSTLYTFHGNDEWDYFGFSVSGAGDVNNDDHDDIVVGAYQDDANGAYTGSARVLSGADGSTLYTFFGDDPDDYFGYSVSGAGDVNNDGFDDIVVAVPYDDDDIADYCGSARVFSGADGSILHTFFGDDEYEYLGYGRGSVSGVGDVNNDDFDDIVVGAPEAQSYRGYARVFSGADGSALYTFQGDQSYEYFGWSVSGAGDVNNDGYPDIVVGAPDADNYVGYTRVYSGEDGSILYNFPGGDPSAELGFSVSGAGDVNNDGFDDILAGVPGDDAVGDYGGSARVFELFVATSTQESCTATNEASISSIGCSLDFPMAVLLHASPGYAGQWGYLLISNGTAIITPPGTVGELCLGGGSLLARYSLDVVAIDSQGMASTLISNSLSGGPGFGIPDSGGQSIQIGDTWNFAYWYRRGALESGFSSVHSITFL